MEKSIKRYELKILEKISNILFIGGAGSILLGFILMFVATPIAFALYIAGGFMGIMVVFMALCLMLK